MSIHRAISACPVCNEEAEVWFYYGKIEPINVVQCNCCSKTYDPSNFIVQLIELYKNVTVSTYTAINF